MNLFTWRDKLWLPKIKLCGKAEKEMFKRQRECVFIRDLQYQVWSPPWMLQVYIILFSKCWGANSVWLKTLNIHFVTVVPSWKIIKPEVYLLSKGKISFFYASLSCRNVCRQKCLRCMLVYAQGWVVSLIPKSRMICMKNITYPSILAVKETWLFSLHHRPAVKLLT